jgi:ribosomal protein S18 acetylase RimI-like enzyme
MAFSARPAVLRCGRCGRFVDWAEARLQVVCGCRPRIDLPPVLTREAGEAERGAVLDLFQQDFGRTRVATLGDVVDLAAVETLVAEMEGGVAGALAWRRIDERLHIVALATDPMWQRTGVGGHLLAEAEALARRLGLPRLVVTTSNDNLPGLYFYQRHGYRIVEIVRDAAARHPELRPIPGFADIPPLDELRLEKKI